MYECTDCLVQFEKVQSIKDHAGADCPACGLFTETRIPQQITVIDRTPKTLGSLADKQRQDLGNYGYGDKMQAFANERKQLSSYCGYLPEGASIAEKKTGSRPFWRPDRDTPDTSLTKLTPTQTQKYIMDGTKPPGLK